MKITPSLPGNRPASTTEQARANKSSVQTSTSSSASLSADDIYAVSAYLLAENKVIGDADEMTETTLPKVKMPNRAGFEWIDAKP